MTIKSKTKMSDNIFITIHSPQTGRPIRLNPRGILYISQSDIYINFLKGVQFYAPKYTLWTGQKYIHLKLMMRCINS